MSTTPAQVLIAGAGPTGLILALTLAQNGIAVRIIEKDVAFHTGQRGPGIQPRTQELLNYLGCFEDIKEQSMVPVKVAIYKMPEGKEIDKIVDMATEIAPTPDVPFRNPRLIGQSHHESILREHLAKCGTDVELGVELVGFTQDEDGVTAELLHHAGDKQGTKETARVDYLVGAEGARSLVRKQLGITFLGETRDTTRFLLADVYIKNMSTAHWHQWGDVSKKILWIRHLECDGLFSVMIGGSEVDCAQLAADKDVLFKFLRDMTSRPDLEFGDVLWLSEFRPNIRMVDKFGEGRAFLVGDAAHVHSPTGGQGLNTGAQDSFNLGWKLSLVLKRLAPASLLASYSDERLPVVKDMLFRTTALLDKTVAFRAGDADASFMRRPKTLHQLGVNYRWSAIVVDEQPGAEEAKAVSAAYREEDPTVLRAGDRAPDAPGLAPLGESTTTSLFSNYKPTHHTALLFTSDAADAKANVEVLKTAPAGSLRVVLVLPQNTDAAKADALKAVDVDTILVDNDGHAYEFYPPAVAGFNTIVVRPDGVVGAVVKSVEGLKQYLHGVFGV